MHRTSLILGWQLVCAGSIAGVALIIALLKPSAFGQPLFLLGLTVTMLATVGAILMPWQQLPKWVTITVPFLDILAIGFAVSAQDLRVGFLWVIPVVWLATYHSGWVVAAAVGFVCACLIAFAGSQGSPSDTTVRVVITTLALSFLGTSIQIGSRRSRAARRLLRRQSEQINRAADRAAGHERRVTDIIDALDTALVAVASDGNILKMNEAYRMLYGRDRFGAQLPAQAVEYDDRRGEPLRRGRTTLARAARGEQLLGERVWLYDTSGRWRALDATTHPTAPLTDDTETTLLILDDVTEQLEASEERRKMVAIVSHELRNPLTAIIGHIDLLLDRNDLPPRVHEQLEVVLRAGERMQHLVSTALETGRAGTTEPEPVDLRVLADAAVELFLPTAAGKGLNLSVVGLETLMTRGDAFRLRQAIDNILSNAVKYTPDGGSVFVRLGVSRDQRAQVTISDTGAGIAADDLERLFEPYFRTSDAVHSGIPGTGLGMGIVRTIIEEHLGDLTVTSQPGEGTHVEMRLPTDAAPAPGMLRSETLIEENR